MHVSKTLFHKTSGGGLKFGLYPKKLITTITHSFHISKFLQSAWQVTTFLSWNLDFIIDFIIDFMKKGGYLTSTLS